MVRFTILKKLKKFNIKTKSETDTEVVLQLFKLKGVNCLEYLNGIYAFAILDKKTDFILCKRQIRN